jgi:hypothetical protein
MHFIHGVYFGVSHDSQNEQLLFPIEASGYLCNGYMVFSVSMKPNFVHTQGVENGKCQLNQFCLQKKITQSQTCVISSYAISGSTNLLTQFFF